MPEKRSFQGNEPDNIPKKVFHYLLVFSVKGKNNAVDMSRRLGCQAGRGRYNGVGEMGWG